MCGETFSQAGLKAGQWPSLQKCCKNQGAACVNCDNTDNPAGIAFTDIVDFADNQDLFYRKFVEAWHMATENGLTLTYLNAAMTNKRHEDHAGADTDCSSIAYWMCTKNANCKTASLTYNGFFSHFDDINCINKHIPQSH